MEAGAETQTCTRCGREWPQDRYHFRWHEGQKRWHSWCRECDRDTIRAYQERKKAERAQTRDLRERVIALLTTPRTADQLREALGESAAPALKWLRERGRLYRAGGTRDHPQWLIGKRCSECKETKPFGVDKLTYWTVDKRGADGSIERYSSRCLECIRERSRRHHAQNREERNAEARDRYRQRMENPEERERLRMRNREAMRRERATKPEQERARRKRSYLRVREDPDRLREFQEKQRMDHRLRVERAGGVVRTSRLDAVEEEGYPTVSTAPFLRWWNAYMAAEPPLEEGGRNREVLAMSMGTTDRNMRRIEKEAVGVELDTVDRAFIRVQIDFVHPVTGLSPASPAYIRGGIPEQTAGAELLRRYYPDLYAPGRRGAGPAPSAEDDPERPIPELICLHVDEEPMTLKVLARSLGLPLRQVEPLVKQMVGGELITVGMTEEGNRGNFVPVYGLG